MHPHHHLFPAFARHRAGFFMGPIQGGQHMNPIREFAVWAVSMLPPDASNETIAITVMGSFFAFFTALGGLAGLLGWICTRGRA
tara:strand:- start:644 stop:895 length:252 start_codon:yes stop_codon:yes gene_type:complete